MGGCSEIAVERRNIVLQRLDLTGLIRSQLQGIAKGVGKPVSARRRHLDDTNTFGQSGVFSGGGFSTP